MTKDEFIRMLKESEVKKAEDTLSNIDVKEVDGVKPADGITKLDSKLPTQKAIEKEVNKDEGPIIPADKDGVSKNGGECDKLEDGKVEAERKKEDNGMKDVINVSSRKVEENSEVSSELLAQLQEAQAREAGYLEEIKQIKAVCEESMKKQASGMAADHAKEMKKVFEAVIAKGEEVEKKLKEASENNEKLYAKAQKMYESSAKLNKILLKALKEAQPEKKMTRYQSPVARATAAFKK